MAVRLEDQELTNRQQQDAKDFIKNHLYGGSYKRTTGKETLYNELRKYIDHVTIIIQLNLSCYSSKSIFFCGKQEKGS